MKTKKVRLAGIVMLAVALIVIGVLVWPIPKPAMALHPTLNIDFEIIWGEAEAHDVDVRVLFYDEDDNLIPGLVADLVPGQGFMWWHCTMNNVADEVERYEISWDIEGSGWDPYPTVWGDIDWPNERIFVPFGTEAIPI